MKREKSPKVYGLGQCSWDHIGIVESFPRVDTKCEFAGPAEQGGGPVATALVALARWGVSCTMAGVTGDDRFGKMIRSSLEDEGIELSGLALRRNTFSQFAFIVAEKSGGRRTIFWRRPTGEPLLAREVDGGALAEADAFLTDGLFVEASLQGAREARRAGVPVIVDGGSLRDGMKTLAGLSDHFIASESFAAELAGGNEPREACRRLADLGAGVAGVTLGPRGYVALEDGKWVEGEAYPVDAVDTTGCGDVFHAGYVFGLLQGWSLEKRLDYGSWAASRVALRPGGRDGIPPWGGYLGRQPP